MKDNKVISIDFSSFKTNVRKDIELYNTILERMQNENIDKLVKIS